MLSLLTHYNVTKFWFQVSAKLSDENRPNRFQIFHIHQIKNLSTKHVQNMPKVQIWYIQYTNWQYRSHM